MLNEVESCYFSYLELEYCTSFTDESWRTFAPFLASDGFFLKYTGYLLT